MSSYLGALFGRCVSTRVGGGGGGEVDDGETDTCDRFTFFDGCWSGVAFAVVVEVADVDLFVGGDRFGRRAREFAGSWIPKDGNDSDLRRVLYGMIEIDGSVSRDVKKVEVRTVRTRRRKARGSDGKGGDDDDDGR